MIIFFKIQLFYQNFLLPQCTPHPIHVFPLPLRDQILSPTAIYYSPLEPIIIVLKNKQTKAMTTPTKLNHSPRSKRNPYQLFHHSSEPQFQNEFLRLYERVKQNAKLSRNTPVLYLENQRKDAIFPNKVSVADTPTKIDGLQEGRRDQHPESPQLFLSASKSPQKLRPLTCNKAQEIKGTQSSRKGRTKLALLIHSKMFEQRDSGSKKSTDVSVNEKQQLKMANLQFQENLKHGEDRIRRLRKEIKDERKRQEMEIFLFAKSIELLKKRTSQEEGQGEEVEQEKEVSKLCQQFMDCAEIFSSLEIESD